jgi:hypothetical protein
MNDPQLFYDVGSSDGAAPDNCGGAAGASAGVSG